MIRKALSVILFVLYIAALAGCNTVHGFGKDVESGGKAIEKASGGSDK